MSVDGHSILMSIEARMWTEFCLAKSSSTITSWLLWLSSWGLSESQSSRNTFSKPLYSQHIAHPGIDLVGPRFVFWGVMHRKWLDRSHGLSLYKAKGGGGHGLPSCIYRHKCCHTFLGIAASCILFSYPFSGETFLQNMFPGNKLHKIFPVLKECVVCPQTNKKEETAVAWYHTGHSFITHSFLLKGEEPPMCIGCDELLTIEHILLTCSDLIKIRVTLQPSHCMYCFRIFHLRRF